MMVLHPIKPVYDVDSQILILGSFPSVKSRESGFYYGHPQNRFWRVLAAVFGEDVPRDIDEKVKLLKNHRVALWDVLSRCEIDASSDASIRNEAPNELGCIFKSCDIKRVFTNGRTAHALYVKHILPVHGVEDICLPSTSPANASWSFEALVGAWEKVKG